MQNKNEPTNAAIKCWQVFSAVQQADPKQKPRVSQDRFETEFV